MKMRKEQVLLLALLAVLFRPASSQDHFEDDEIDDDCHVKTSIILKKLDTCDSQKIKDDFRRNQLWTDVVKETIGAMMKQQQEEIKSRLDHLTNKLENKLEVVVKQARDDKLEIKSTMDRNLQSVEENKKQMEDVMLLLALPISERACQRMLAAWPLIERNATMFFKAMGRTFYYNRTQTMTWYETRDWCRSRGMQLATLKTAEEVKQVDKTLTSKTSPRRDFWVSASDIGRSPGQFQWADGTPVLKSTWASDRPKYYKANQETCAYIFTGHQKLSDYSCSEKYSTLCEVPELLATCL